MGFGNSKYICIGSKFIVLLNLLFLTCNTMSQNYLKMRFPIHYPTADIPAIKDITIVSDCPIDSIFWDCGCGSFKKNRIRLRNYEEEKISPFDVIFYEFSPRTLEDYVFIKKCKEDHVNLETRCVYGYQALYTIDYSGLEIQDSDYCFSRHIRMNDADDTTLTAVYHVVKDVNVVRLKLKKEHLILDSSLGLTNDCGLFYLEIPLNEEVFFGFFRSPYFIIWFRIYISTDGTKPESHKALPCRKTRVRWRPCWRSTVRG